MLCDSQAMSVAIHRHIDEEEAEGPDWIERDPARAAAMGLVAIAVVIRVVIATRGFLANDDFVLDAQAAASSLNLGYLVHEFNNHLMPGELIIIWTSVHIFGLEYWPYVILMAIGELIIGVLFYRLLRSMVGPGWRLLVPLAVLMFSPLTLESTSWVVVAFNVLPMQIATILALGAMYKYTRTLQWRHLLSMGGAVVFGLLFFEKSLLIAPLLFIATACIFVPGDFWRSLRRTITRFSRAWLVLAVICGAYLGVYLTRPPSTPLGIPSGAGSVMSFVGQLTGETVSTSLLGGPWRWISAGDTAPDVAPPLAATWVSAVLVLALIVFTMARRRRAGRAWLMAALYLLIECVLLSSTRLGGWAAGAAGQATRYVADAAPVIALAVGLALYGMVGERAKRARPPGIPRELVPLMVLAAVVITAGTAYSLYGYGQQWSVKAGREYLQNAEADLDKAPAGTVFFDETVPPVVVVPLFYPDTLQSHFFRALKRQPTFVDETSKLSAFDSTGHIRLAYVAGPSVVPPTEKLCGYRVTGKTPTALPMSGSIYAWPWVVEVTYASSGETTATLQLGDTTHQFPVHTGLNKYFFHMTAGGNRYELSVADPKVVMCTTNITIGNVVAEPA
jgi:hypothetical protein